MILLRCGLSFYFLGWIPRNIILIQYQGCWTRMTLPVFKGKGLAYMCLIHVLGSQEYFKEMEPTALCPLDLISNSIVDMEVCLWPHILNEFSRSTCNLKSLILQCVLLDNFSI